MCGRFAVTTDPARLAQEIHALDETGGAGLRPPNYNVAPTADIAAVVARHDQPADRRAGAERPGMGTVRAGAERPGMGTVRAGAERPGMGTAATRRIRLMRWGLLPPWSKPGPDGGLPVKGPQLINARAETVTTSPAYRSAAQHKRCLIPMDGYYEWQPATDVFRANNPKRGPKTPFYFYRPDGQPLLVAGLWSVWRPGPAGRSAATGGSDPAGGSAATGGSVPPGLLTCTVITTDAVGDFATVHDRMPLLLGEDDWDRWLDPDAPAPADLLAAPPDTAGLAMREVSRLVNSVANNGPELIAPAEPGDQPVGLF